MSAGNGHYKPGDIVRGGHRVDPVTRRSTGEEMEFRVIGEVPTRQLSARKRSEQMDALVQQVEDLTRQHNALLKAVDGLMARTDRVERHIKTHEPIALGRIDSLERAADGLATFDREQDRRIDAIERGAAVLSAWVRRPFWQRVRGRIGL